MVSASATAAAPLSRQFADRVQSYVFIMSRQNISPPFRLSLLFRKLRTGYIYNKVRFRAASFKYFRHGVKGDYVDALVGGTLFFNTFC